MCKLCRSLFTLLYFFIWPLCCLLFSNIQILFTPLVSFDHCVVCCSPIYKLWLLLWFLLTIVLSVVLRYTDYVYPFGFCWPLRCLLFSDIQIVFTPLVSSNSSYTVTNFFNRMAYLVYDKKKSNLTLHKWYYYKETVFFAFVRWRSALFLIFNLICHQI